MARLGHLAIVLFALLPCLLLPAGAGAAMPAGARHDLLLLRSGAGAATSLISQRMDGSAVATHLPFGLVDQAGRTLYVASPTAPDAVGKPRSLVRAVDIASGRTVRSLLVPGHYSTQAGDYSADTLSYNGRWLALRAAASAVATQAIVIDTAAMRVAATVQLPGHFSLDAIDAGGHVLYLIEHLGGPGANAYRVRSYRIQPAVLDPGPVVEKENTTGTMNGVAWTRAWSSGGDWLFTLYVHPGHTGAFIHVLGVKDRFAQCVDLPVSKATASSLAHYAVIGSPDGKSLYAVNPLLGRVEVMRDSMPFGTLDGAGLGVHAGSVQPGLNQIAITPNGMTLFVATGRGIWVIDTGSLALRAVYLRGRRVASVTLSRDGRRLYALEPDGARITALNPAGGRVEGQVATQSGAWAMAQVASQQ